MAEEALDPDLEICDAHHHLWDRGGQRYLVEEFSADTSAHNVTKSVYVECVSRYREDGPRELRPVGEVEFVDRITAGTKVASGIVGFADLTLGSGARNLLEAEVAASPRFRGIRHASAWDASDKVHNAHTKPSQYLLADRTFREGFTCLGELGLSFDAWAYFPQIPELTDLARTFPDTAIILNHVGGPIGVGPYAGKRDEVFATWRGYMRDLADCPNVTVKLGGLTMALAGFGWHKLDKPASSADLAAAMKPYYLECIESFGPSRCMFESNYPVDATGATYTVLWNAFKRVAQDFSEAERRELFHDTAVRVYNLANEYSAP